VVQLRRSAKTTTIVLIAIRETLLSASWGPIQCLPRLSVHHRTIILRGFKGALTWKPIIPRDTSLLENGTDDCGSFAQSANDVPAIEPFDL